MEKVKNSEKTPFLLFFNRMKALAIALFTLAAILNLKPFVFGGNAPVRVNVDNFVQAHTAFQFDRIIEEAGGVNKWNHSRLPTSLDKQSAIHMNRDTLSSFAVVDILKDATLMLPDAGKRYMSVMVVDEDHYIKKVFQSSGTYKLTIKEFESPRIALVARIFVNASDERDIKISSIAELI